MRKTSVILIVSILLFSECKLLYGQGKEKEKIKKGWIFGFFPAFGYDPNTGTKYGGILKLYDYGDGESYPKYDQSIHFEWSATTKGQAIRQLTYDTRNIIPGIRMLAEASYITDKVFSFYGLNGYNAYYNSSYTDSDSPLYRSSVFYANERILIKTKLELIGRLKGKSLMWVGGFEYLNTRLDTVNTTELNEGRNRDDYLPSIGGGLYGDFIRWGIIPHDQADGGPNGMFKIGIKYDTRDRESNPMKGLWTEMQLLFSPGFLSEGYSYARLAITHRQYLAIIPGALNLAYRISWQSKVAGEMPVYMLPLVYNSAPQITLSGLGGSKTIRGVLRNRVVGEDFVYGNAEMRWKVLRTIILNQNFYIALAGFADAGMITGKYRLPEISDPEGLEWLSKGETEKPHVTYGAGIHFAINDNFVISWDYAKTADPRDGSGGNYVGVGYLF
jgi:outer membrane protein assembly factor BamA